MIKIDYLKNYPYAISTLAKIWHQGIGKEWFPDISLAQAEDNLYQQLNDNKLPFCLVAFVNDIPVAYV